MSDVIKDIWKEGGDGHFTQNDPKYFIQLFNSYQSFKGTKVLEFGPGNGEFAKWMLDTYKTITDYTIVDAPRSIEIPKKTLENYEQVNFYEAQDFREALKKSYDIFVSFNCLSETPPSYYKEVFETVKTKGIFIIDGDLKNYDFQEEMDSFSRKMKAMVVSGRVVPMTAIIKPDNREVRVNYNSIPTREGALIPMGGRVNLHTKNM